MRRRRLQSAHPRTLVSQMTTLTKRHCPWEGGHRSGAALRVVKEGAMGKRKNAPFGPIPIPGYVRERDGRLEWVKPHPRKWPRRRKGLVLPTWPQA